MKCITKLVSLATIMLLSNESGSTSAMSIHSSHRTHSSKIYDPEPFKKMFAQIDTEIDQVNRNKDQGVIGRQLGLTKVVSMKMHVKDLHKDILSKIKLV